MLGAVVAACLLLPAAFLVSSVSLALPSARSAIEERLARLTGGPVRVEGEARFSLFPRASVSLVDVRIGTAAGEEALALDVDRIDADFDLVSALFGRTEIDRVTLVRPELVALGPVVAAVPAAAPPAAPAAPRTSEPTAPADRQVDTRRASDLAAFFLSRFEGLHELHVRDGLFRLAGRGGGVSNVNLAFEWAGGGAPAIVDGSYVWNGQPTEIDGRFDSPLDFLAGTPSALALQVSSPALELGFSGSGAAGDSLHLAGGLRVAAPSLSRAIRWLGTRQLTLPDIGAVSLETQIQLVSDRVSFGAAQLDLGGNEARGALEAILPRGGARASLSGTLAFDRLDFGVLSQAIAPTPRTLIDLERPIRSSFIRALDMDLRLSARRATLGRASASEVAATVKMASGVGVIDVGDMAVLGGRGQMRVTLDARADVPTLIVTAGVRDAGVGEVAALVNEPLPFASGSALIGATLRSPAGNWGQILASNRGEFTAEIRDGALQGIDAALLKSAGRHALDFSVASAGAPFQSIRIKAQSLGTRVRFDDIAAVMQDGEIAASGQFDLRGDGLQIAGNMQSPRIEASGRQDSFTTSQPLRFTLRGEWPKPVMTVGSPAEPI